MRAGLSPVALPDGRRRVSRPSYDPSGPRRRACAARDGPRNGLAPPSPPARRCGKRARREGRSHVLTRRTARHPARARRCQPSLRRPRSPVAAGRHEGGCGHGLGDDPPGHQACAIGSTPDERRPREDGAWCRSLLARPDGHLLQAIGSDGWVSIDSGSRPTGELETTIDQSRQVILSMKDHEARALRSALAFDDAAQATHFKSPRRTKPFSLEPHL